MTMNRLITTALVGSIALGGIGLGGLAIASGDHNESEGRYQSKHCKQGGERHKKGMKKRVERMIRHLDLSDEQATKVRGVFDKYSDQFTALRTEKKKSKQSLRENMHADKQDMAAIEQLAKKQGELKTQKILVKAKMKAEINTILTESQREKMKSMRGKRDGGEYRKYRDHD